MNLDFTRMDLVKCIIIMRPRLTAAGIANIMGEQRAPVDSYISKMVKQGLICSDSPARYSRRFMATVKLASTFRVTNEMLEYLGLKDVSGKKRKFENIIFGECKKSPHQQRMMWFHGRGEFPGFGQLP